MMNTKTITLSLATLGLLSITSCNKPECHECHYDGPTGAVELGEYCDEDLENIEASGYTDTSGTYVVHCHDH